MPVTYPNESTDYRAARDALLKSEIELRAKIEAVAEERRKLPLGGRVEDYRFKNLNGDDCQISSLFGQQDSLALYSLMFAPGDDAPCPMCVSMLDGLNAQATHISQRIALAVVAANTPEALSALADARGWGNLNLVSAADTSYQRDYHAERDGGQLPIMNVFRREGDAVHHFWGSELFFADVPGQPRHVDQLWPLWNVFDLTPEGRGEDWYPALNY